MLGTRQRNLKVRLGAPTDKPTQSVCDGAGHELVTPGRSPCGNYTRYSYKGRVALNLRKLAVALKIPKNGGRRQKRREDGSCDQGNWEPVGNRVFWNHMADTFHERLTFEEVAAQFWVMAHRPDLRFLVLTKRPERALEFFAWVATSHRNPRAVLGSAFDSVMRGQVLPRVGVSLDMAWPLPNVAIGVSAEDQKRSDERVPLLRQIPAVMRFVSMEPMLGPVDLSRWLLPHQAHCPLWPGSDWEARFDAPCTCGHIDWVISGAESGPGRRPCELKWMQDLGRQVLDAQVWETPQVPDPDPESAPGSYIETGAPEFVSGPALFFKQGDVCPKCAGAILLPGPGVGQRFCVCVDHGGQTGKLRKGCPELYIPGHGAQQWRQFPVGWAS